MSIVEFGILNLWVSGLLLVLSVVVLSLIYLERKVLGRLQMRIGPMRVGPYGTLQTIADAIKLITKEDIQPEWADKRVYWVAPVLVFIPSFMVWVAIPFSSRIVVQDLDLGLFYVMAFLVLSIVGLVMAGWGSANKYAVIGGLRAAGQLVSYEIPVIMVVAGIAILTQSLSLSYIVEQQQPVPFIVVLPLGLFLFFIAGLAELGRTPFDIYEAESEVVGGPFVEYSGAHWAVFFLAEYVSTFAIAALTSLLFLGGWGWSSPIQEWVGNPIGAEAIAFGEMFIKTYLVVVVIFWVRGTFPRFRIEQLMALGWKVMVPLSFVFVLLVAFATFYGWPWWVLSAINVVVLITLGWYYHKMMHRDDAPVSVVLHSAREVRDARQS